MRLLACLLLLGGFSISFKSELIQLLLRQLWLLLFVLVLWLVFNVFLFFLVFLLLIIRLFSKLRFCLFFCYLFLLIWHSNGIALWRNSMYSLFWMPLLRYDEHQRNCSLEEFHVQLLSELIPVFSDSAWMSFVFSTCCVGLDP